MPESVSLERSPSSANIDSEYVLDLNDQSLTYISTVTRTSMY